MSFRGIMNSPPPLRQALLGSVFIVLIFLTSYCGIIAFMPFFLSVFLLRLPSARLIVDSIIATWFAFASGLFELVYGVNIVVKGDAHLLKEEHSALIIMNHRTRLDWLFLFSLQVRHGSLRRFKISLKSSLSHIPGAGWAMQIASFIFLKRNWELDKPHIERLLEYFETMHYRPQMLLFPEGTDLTEKNKAKSANYAKQHDLPVLEYVLHPRTTGFTSIARFMTSHNELDQIVDVTVMYPYNCLQNEMDLFYHDLPREIVFHVKAFDVRTLPKDSDSLQKWVETRWLMKEKYLKTFFETGKHPDDVETTPGEEKENRERIARLSISLALTFWVSFVIASIVLFSLFSYVRYFYFVSTVVYAGISSFVGFENVLIKIVSR